MMRKIVFIALGAAWIALSVLSGAGAAERHHARRTTAQPTVRAGTDLRNAYAQFGRAYRVYDARAWGGAVSAPAGR
jgi:hypothetical protein